MSEDHLNTNEELKGALFQGNPPFDRNSHNNLIVSLKAHNEIQLILYGTRFSFLFSLVTKIALRGTNIMARGMNNSARGAKNIVRAKNIVVRGIKNSVRGNLAHE